MSRLYDTDFTAWVDETTQLLAERRFEEIDIDALIEEVESLGASERRAYRSHLAIIIEHLLRLVHAPSSIYERNERGWQHSVADARDEIAILLENNASAARDQDDSRRAAHWKALRRVKRYCEDFGPVEWPETCPWTVDELCDEAFWPEREHHYH